MANHFIIGLGGTGGHVLREFRKRVYQEFGSNKPDNGVHLEYLYVDSSDDDLNSREGWKIMNKSVHLKEAQKVSIHGIGMNMFNNLGMYPGIQSFLSAEEVDMMQNQLGPLVTAGIGGQRRRLGRLLFANNLASNDNGNDFLTRVRQTVRSIQDESGDQMVTFHICAGLAGGTGSGSIIDAMAQIRNEYKPQPGATEYKVFLYLYVPEMVVANTNHDSGFYQANGYAALVELNAMSVGSYLPLNATGKRDPFTGGVERLLGGIEAFDGAYLYTNVNQAGKTLRIGTTLPAAVADFMFQKTVYSEGAQMRRLSGCENDGAGPEYDQSGTATRSRKFLTFGIKTIEYPESEIKECVTYNFARQATRQLQYNFWQDGIGYGEVSIDEIGTGFRDEIKTNKNRELLHLANSYLMLSKPIIENNVTKHWRDIDETWEGRTQMFADEVQNGEEKKSWFAIFTKKVDDYYDRNYRTHGVKKFYEIQEKEIKGYAKTIRRHIEKHLFDQWQTGTISLIEVEKYTSILIDDCRERVTAFKTQVSTQEDEAKNQNANIKGINIEWDNIGWLRDAVTGASKKVFAKYKTAKCALCAANTRMEAYNYAQKLMSAVIEQLTLMLEGIKEYHSEMTQIMEAVSTAADSKCNDDEANTDNTIVMKKYDPQHVQLFVKQCVADKERQADNANSIRQRMAQMLGEDEEKSFVALLNKTDYDTALDIILDICTKSAVDSMTNAAANDPLNKMVGVNILEKLKNEYNTEEKLENLVRGWVNEAQCYMQFNQEEQAKVFGNAGGGMMKMIQVRLPEYDNDQTGFRQKLINMFRQVSPGFNPDEDLSVMPKSSQIVIIAGAAGFPLRYVSNIGALREKYTHLLANPTEGKLNKMVLHTESFDRPLPALFEMSEKELRRSLVQPVLLGYAMGLFAKKENPETGAHFEAMNFPNDWGDNWEPMGKDILDTMTVLSKNYALAQKVMAKVDAELAKVRSNDQKAVLRIKLGKDVVNGLIKEHPSIRGNEFSPLYKEYRAEAQNIMDNKLKDL